MLSLTSKRFLLLHLLPLLNEGLPDNIRGPRHKIQSNNIVRRFRGPSDAQNVLTILKDVAFIQFVRQRSDVDQRRGRDKRYVDHDLFHGFAFRGYRRILTSADGVIFYTLGCS